MTYPSYKLHPWSCSNSDPALHCFAKLKNQTNKILENRPKIARNLEWYTTFILFVYTLLKVVGYYDVCVLSMSVMGFQKKKQFE